MWAAYISAFAAVGALVLGIGNRKKITQVHVLVNNQLDQVMTKLKDSQDREQVLKDNQKNEHSLSLHMDNPPRMASRYHPW
jgi:hypothetical protein